MIELVSTEPIEGEEVDTIELFSLDGEVYTIPDKSRPTVALQYLYIARKQGIGIAESWLAEELLGVRAYEALLNFQGLTQDNMNEIITMARAVVFGEVRPKGRANGTRSKTAPRKVSSTTKTTNGSPKPRTRSSRT